MTYSPLQWRQCQARLRDSAAEWLLGHRRTRDELGALRRHRVTHLTGRGMQLIAGERSPRRWCQGLSVAADPAGPHTEEA